MPGDTTDLEKFIEYRQAEKHDMNFVRSAWLNGLYHGSDWYTLIPRDIFDSKFNQVMNHILSKPRVRVTLAVVKEEPSAIVGFSIYEFDQAEDVTLHWLYVKPAWRDKGVARTLVHPDTAQVTHMTKIGKSLLRKAKDVIFNPFAI